MENRSYFEAKVSEWIRREQNGEPFVFSSFLTMEEAAIAERICKKEGAPFDLIGGCDENERKVLVISSWSREELMPCLPFLLLCVTGRDLKTLSHRDVLGALMSLGIRRDLIGDIVARDGVVAFFAMDHIADYLIQNLTSIGRLSVELSVADEFFELPQPRFEELRLTVASLRADAVVAAFCKCSRDQAVRLIEEGAVFINHSIIEKKTKEVCAGDCVNVRRFGKWIVDQCGDMTKKGRTVLLCRKYINIFRRII